MWDGLTLKKKLLVFSAIAVVALVFSVITHTWLPVIIAVFLDIGITGMMIQINNGALDDK